MGMTTAFRNIIPSLISGGATNHYDTTNGYFCVGTSTQAFSAADTDMIAGGVRKQLTTVTPSSNVLTVSTSYGTSDANQAWNEWGIANASTSGTLMCRKQEGLGTKASGQTWVPTATITFTIGA
jgi:hypothetical protein